MPLSRGAQCAVKTRRRLLFCVSLLVILTGIALIPRVHWGVIGWWRRDAFYRGMPSSAWLTDLRQSIALSRSRADALLQWRRTNALDHLCNWWTGAVDDGYVEMGRHPLVEGDTDAIPVLIDLCFELQPEDDAMAITLGLALDRTEPGKFAVEAVNQLDEKKLRLPRRQKVALVKDYCKHIIQTRSGDKYRAASELLRLLEGRHAEESISEGLRLHLGEQRRLRGVRHRRLLLCTSLLVILALDSISRPRSKGCQRNGLTPVR